MERFAAEKIVRTDPLADADDNGPGGDGGPGGMIA
jgi:hypothetical protein